MEQGRDHPARQNTPSGKGGGIAGQLLGLSLFIMLLAFFIVLNSISTFDDSKIEPVSGSLEQAFSGRINLLESLNAPLANSDKTGTGTGKTLDRIAGMFKAELTHIQTTSNHAQGQMHIRIGRAEFERVVDSVATGGKPTFLSTLASLLRSGDRQNPYIMDVVYNLSDNPARLANRKREELDKEIDAIAAMAQKIEQAGLPARHMTVGLQKGRVDLIELTFRRLESGETTGNNDGGEGEGDDGE